MFEKNIVVYNKKMVKIDSKKGTIYTEHPPKYKLLKPRTTDK